MLSKIFFTFPVPLDVVERDRELSCDMKSCSEMFQDDLRFARLCSKQHLEIKPVGARSKALIATMEDIPQVCHPTSARSIVRKSSRTPPAFNLHQLHAPHSHQDAASSISNLAKFVHPKLSKCRRLLHLQHCRLLIQKRRQRQNRENFMRILP